MRSLVIVERTGIFPGRARGEIGCGEETEVRLFALEERGR